METHVVKRGCHTHHTGFSLLSPAAVSANFNNCLVNQTHQNQGDEVYALTIAMKRDPGR